MFCIALASGPTHCDHIAFSGLSNDILVVFLLFVFVIFLVARHQYKVQVFDNLKYNQLRINEKQIPNN